MEAELGQQNYTKELILLLKEFSSDPNGEGLGSLTLKQIRRRLEDRLSIPAGTLDAEKKAIKQVIMKFSEKNSDNSENINGAENRPKASVSQGKKSSGSRTIDSSSEGSDTDSSTDSRPRTSVKRKRKKTSKTGRNSRKKLEQDISSRSARVKAQLQALGAMHKAAGLGPNIYKGLPKSGTERVEALSEAIKTAGVSFSGLIPNRQEISLAKSKKERERDLDGIDTSNIIFSGNGRRQRRNRAPVKYTVSDAESEEDNEKENASNVPLRDTVNQRSEEESSEEESDFYESSD
mmetsp:Transcript_11117/g.14475  ORF Transcript_11117/g.14475 Transcript_11117/m.14475 type:complete len:292 (-) Transcript_11117:1950-2825(-)